MKVLTWFLCSVCTSCFHIPRRKIVDTMTQSIVPLGLILSPESSHAIGTQWTLSDLYDNVEDGKVRLAEFRKMGRVLMY